MSCGSPQGEIIVNRKKVIEIDNIIDLPDEEWREIKGYSRYMVSNMGRIKSLKHAQARILHTFVNNKGYERVCLS